MALEMTPQQHHHKGNSTNVGNAARASSLTKGTNHMRDHHGFAQLQAMLFPRQELPNHHENRHCGIKHTTLCKATSCVGSAVSSPTPVPAAQLSAPATSLIFCSDLDPCSGAGPGCCPVLSASPLPRRPPVPGTTFPLHGYSNAGTIPKLPRMHTMPLRGLLKSDAPI